MKAWLVVLAGCAHAPAHTPLAPVASRCTLPLAAEADAGEWQPARAREGTIASVSLEGAPALAPLLRGVIETHTGESLAEAPLGDDLRRLWAFGVLADAHVDARETPAGIAVVFALVPQPRIRAVSGADAPELRRLRWLAGTPFEPKRIARVVREIEAAYLRDGYLDATVSVHRSAELDLCVRAYRGPQVTIRKLTFPGARGVSPPMLLDALHGKGVNHPGGTYDADALSEDHVRLIDLYFERGMLDAKIGEPVLERYNDKVDVAVPITEGAVYHLAALSGLAVPHGIQTGDLFVRSKIANGVRELATALDAYVTPETTVDLEHHRVAIRFDIEWRMPWSALRLLSWH